MNDFTTVRSGNLDIAVETSGSGRLIVFAHGLTGNRKSTQRKFAHLSDRYRIVTFDQRGHHQSTAITDPTLYDARRMAGDMAAVMDAFHIDRAIVGGESMGAATALMFALQWPERVETLLLTAPAFGDKPNPETAAIRQMGVEIADRGLETYLDEAAIRQRDELGWPPDVIAAVAEMQGLHDGDSLATACQTVIDWELFTDLEVLSTLDMPVCIIAWKDDTLHPYALAERMAAIIPNARLEQLPALVDVFRNPSSIGDIYARFLENQN